MEKRFRVVPRGIGLVIGCCTFPTWNGYPGLFASLATGNAVVVKPHPGGDPAARDHGAGSRAKCWPRRASIRTSSRWSRTTRATTSRRQLALRPEVQASSTSPAARRTAAGSRSTRGRRRSTPRRPASTRSSSTAPPTSRRVARNVAFSLSLYTGPDVHGAAEHLRAEATASIPRRAICRSTRSRQAIADGVQQAARPIPRARSRCWARCRTTACCAGSRPRARSARSCSTRETIAHPAFPEATIRTPLIVKLDAADRATYLNEWFGPIAFVDRHRIDRREPRDRARRGRAATARSRCRCIRRSDDVIDRAIDVAEDAGVALSINLTGGVFVNQSAAFSDFHGTGANPAANASLTDAAYRRQPLPRRPASAARLRQA